uniref:Uncharacterized protein n=1 Tax=Arundo donax TaxID=35708 RepID=A0A0A9AJP9_ARUDO
MPSASPPLQITKDSIIHQ